MTGFFHCFSPCCVHNSNVRAANRTSTELLALGAIDTSPRPIHYTESIDVRCHICQSVGSIKWQKAVRNLNERGWAYQCPACLLQKIRLSRSKTYDTECLEKHGLVDLTPRIIKSSELVEIRCHGCGSVGRAKWGNAQRSLKRYGHAYQCRNCLNAKYSRRKAGGQWLDKIRAAAQTEAHKERARQNGKKRLKNKRLGSVLEVWHFGDVDVQSTPGTSVISGTCLKCGSVEEKPLKKFIEGSNRQSGGCSSCWLNIRSSGRYSETMKSRSIGFWSSEGSLDARRRLADRSVELQNAYERWAAENPDKLYTSAGERELLSWITDDLGLSASKLRISGKEIDIYIPSLNIGIEYNGLYWHSELQRDRLYHLDKMNFFREKGIKVINLFEHEWRDRRDQVKSFLRSAFELNHNRAGARQLAFHEIPSQQASKFLESTHIQGPPNSMIWAVGGFLGDKLLVVASFGKHHRGKSGTVLSRFAAATGWTVSGALSKVSKIGFERFGPLVSWCDRRWSDGEGYRKAGWKADGVLGVDYFYTDFKNVYSKQSRRKGLVGTPAGMTEREHALLDGLVRVYDCGKIRFVYDRS